MARYDFFATKKVTSVGKLIGFQANRILASMLMSHFKTTDRQINILEIVPGQGDFAIELIKRSNVTYLSYEADEELYKILREKNIQAKYGRIPPLNENDNSFDAVVMLNVLEHMQNVTEAEAIIREIRRVLKTGGILFTVTPSFMSWGKDFYNFDYTHTFITTELRLNQLFSDNGFFIIKIGYHYGNFFSEFGRIAAALTRAARKIADVFTPRNFGRKQTIQKMAMLFAENIITISRKSC